MAKSPSQIRVPADAVNAFVGMDKGAIEELVKSILGGQAGRGIDQIVISGGPDIGGRGAQPDWDKTIWSRDC